MPLRTETSPSGDLEVWATINAGRKKGEYLVRLVRNDETTPNWERCGDRAVWKMTRYEPKEFALDGRPISFEPISSWTLDADGVEEIEPGSGATVFEIALEPVVGWRMAQAVARRFGLSAASMPPRPAPRGEDIWPDLYAVDDAE